MKNCKLCKKLFHSLEQDIFCQFCQDDLSDSQNDQKIQFKRHSITKNIQFNKKHKLKSKVVPYLHNKKKLQDLLIKKYSQRLLNWQLSNSQYDYLSYIQRQNSLQEQQKHILAEIYWLCYQHRNDNLSIFQDRYHNLGFENHQLLTFMHYIQLQAPITIEFKGLEDLLKLVHIDILPSHFKACINICNDPVQSIKSKQIGYSSYFVLKETVRKRCLLDVHTKSSKIRKVPLQISQYLLNSLGDCELSRILQEFYNQQIDNKCLGLCEPLQILGQMYLSRHITKICIDRRQIKHDTVDLLNNLQQRYQIRYQIFQY